MKIEFGKRLAEYRKEKKIQQKDLAEKVNINVTLLSKYEKGDVQPSIEVATKLAEGAGVSLDYLTGLADETKIKDRDIYNRLLSINDLSKEKQQFILELLDITIRDAKVQDAYK